MEHQFILYLILIISILGLNMIAQKLKVAYPIILVTGGLLISFIPAMPQISIDPELIFVIFLPPLLFEAAWYTSWKEFWKWRRIISSFAFLIVLATSLVVALVGAAYIPGITLALGFLLGGIVSPPDAVSTSAILRNIKVPRGLVSITEGESLLNDASSLVVFRFALIAVSTGKFVFHEAAVSFLWVILAGLAVGLILGYIIYRLHLWLPTDANTDIIVTLITPYILYITAEHFDVSGVLAVVSGGLFLSSKSHLFLSHKSRLQGSNVWASLTFVLNGIVFMLIGLELPVIVDGLGDTSLSVAIGYGLLITAVLIVSRLLCCFGASYFTVFISRFITTADNNPGLKTPLIFGWAGMRGVVSLAAALSIPEFLPDGHPFPERDLLLFITFIVILMTLIVQGLTLPWLIKLVKLENPDGFVPEHEQEKLIRQRIATETRKYLSENHAEILKKNTALNLLSDKLQTESFLNENKRQLQEYQTIYLDALDQQRKWLHDWNKDIRIDEEIIRKQLLLIDIEEEKTRLRFVEDVPKEDF